MDFRCLFRRLQSDGRFKSGCLLGGEIEYFIRNDSESSKELVEMLRKNNHQENGAYMFKHRELSNLQKKVLIFMLSADSFSSGLFPLQNIKRSLRNHCVYYACYLLETSGLVRMQRRPNRRVFIELSDAGRTIAASLIPVEYRQHREAGNRILPSRAQRREMRDIEIDIRGRPYTVSRAAFVIRPDGTTSLALWGENNEQAWLNGDARQVSEWYQACYDAGLPVNVQVEDDRWMDWLGDRLPGR